jgi:hypothetical protein
MAEEEPIVDVAEEVEAVEEDEFVPTTGAADVKLFGKWSFDDIEVSDLSLEVCVVVDSGIQVLYSCLDKCSHSNLRTVLMFV